MPKVSVVIPTYNVARWLPEFLSSLDAQTGGLADHELLFVDDGSPDESAGMIESWIARSGSPARIIHKANGGLSSARNAGLAEATGDWVTFWDPDDILEPTYAVEIREFLQTPAAQTVDLIAGRSVMFLESTGRRMEHPLDHRFRRDDRVVDLENDPDGFHLAANTGFFRTSVLRENGLKFDSRVVPSFEDGHLTARYLARTQCPQIALRSRARYLYRRRADESSLVQAGWRKPQKYLDQPRYGWLDLLQAVRASRGSIPVWTQFVVLYEMSWYFRSENRWPSRTSWITDDLSAGFHETLREVLKFIDVDSVARFANSRSAPPPDLIACLLEGGLADRPRRRSVTVDRIDPARRLTRLRYYHGETTPAETVRIGGRIATPVHAKTRRIEFLGRTMAQERIAWFAGIESVAVSLDGVSVPVVVGRVGHQHVEATPQRMWRTLANRRVPEGKAKSAPRPAGLQRRVAARAVREFRRRLPKGLEFSVEAIRAETTRRASATAVARRNFHNCWLLYDDGGENVEHLYRYLLTEQLDVNAWYVLGPGKRWDALAAEKFRLLDPDGLRYRIARPLATRLIGCVGNRHLLEPEVTADWAAGVPGIRYTMLPTAVIEDDLSHWMNPDAINLIAMTTRPEQAALADTGNRYRFTSLEAVLTGMPRHDRLLRLAAQTPQPRTVLFVPSQRRTLSEERIDAFWAGPETPAVWDEQVRERWSELLTSERLHKAAAAAGLNLVLLLDQESERQFDGRTFEAISVRRRDALDVQKLLADTAVLVTDYSPLAADIAFLGRASVSYQFPPGPDPASARHLSGRVDHGFGPACADAEAVVEALLAILDSGCTPQNPYAERMQAAFAFHDSESCARLHRLIRDLTTAQKR